MLLVGSDHEHASAVECGLERRLIHIGGQLVGTMDLAGDGSELVRAFFVTAVHEQLSADHLGLNLLGSEELDIESDLELVVRVVHSNDSIGILERPVPHIRGVVVSDRNSGHGYGSREDYGSCKDTVCEMGTVTTEGTIRENQAIKKL